jgi:AraC-like DNA-binding protein
LEPLGAFFRLDRCARDFEPVASPVRRLAPGTAGIASASELSLDGWREGSLGDAMHKLVRVVSGQIDLEGASGGWVVVPNQFVFIPADRAFIVRTAKRTVLQVAHLQPAIHNWHHPGCWVTSAPLLAREMLGYAVRRNSDDAGDLEGAQQFFKTLSHLCRDWFSTPRIMWLPAAKSPEMRALVTYVRYHLTDATIGGACAATSLSVRTLQRRCSEELSFGWREFVREARILRAAELLAEGRHSVGAVAQSIGFSSLSAFTLAFSKRAGMSPSEFVRQHSVPGLSVQRAKLTNL